MISQLQHTNHVQPKCTLCLQLTTENRIGGVIVSAFASSAVYRRFEPQSGQAKDYNIDIYCYSAKHALARRNSKDWLVRNWMICLGWAICASTDLCCSELALSKYN